MDPEVNPILSYWAKTMALGLETAIAVTAGANAINSRYPATTYEAARIVSVKPMLVEQVPYRPGDKKRYHVVGLQKESGPGLIYTQLENVTCDAGDNCEPPPDGLTLRLEAAAKKRAQGVLEISGGRVVGFQEIRR